MEDLLNHLTDKLEQKKTEAIVARGGERALKEALAVHKKFLYECKEQLQSLATESKVTPEVANFTLGWLEKFGSRLVAMLEEAKSLGDVRSGEVLAHDSFLKTVKGMSEKETMEPQVVHVNSSGVDRCEMEMPVVESTSTSATPSKQDQEVKKQKRPTRTKPLAQEKSKKIDETVDRIKKSRRNKSIVDQT